jgi:hypothetical protein
MSQKRANLNRLEIRKKKQKMFRYFDTKGKWQAFWSRLGKTRKRKQVQEKAKNNLPLDLNIPIE